MPGMPVSIFISYSRVDSAFVDRLEQDLKTYQFHTWVDRRKLEGGQDWMDELQRAINQCHVLLVILSPEAAASEYVRMEYRYARRRGKILIPLYHRPTSEVPIDLDSLQWVDFQGAYEAGLQALLKSLQHVGISSPAPLSPPLAAQPKAVVPPSVGPSPHSAPPPAPKAGNDEPVPASPPAPKTVSGRAVSGLLTPGAELQHKRYRIEKALAKGSMGTVYQGFDQHSRHPCAIKELLDTFSNEEEREQALQRFEREAHMLLDLHHTAIAKVFDFFAENGRNYLIMEFVDGRTLAEVLEQEGQPRGLHEGWVRSWAAQLCHVLAYLHSQNPPVIFRDLKPSNIMITSDGRVKLINFGIAHSFQSGLQGFVMTLGYAPPEQLEGKPVPRSDIYALGATLHRLLTRHDAINNKPSIFDFPTIRSIRPEISPQLDAIIGRALQRDSDARWPSASEMGQAISRLPPL